MHVDRKHRVAGVTYSSSRATIVAPPTIDTVDFLLYIPSMSHHFCIVRIFADEKKHDLPRDSSNKL